MNIPKEIKNWLPEDTDTHLDTCMKKISWASHKNVWALQLIREFITKDRRVNNSVSMDVQIDEELWNCGNEIQHKVI